jgi:probable F420-dependent oxidoreductase
MRLGIHLPQYGRAAGPEAIQAAARQAEQLGLDDVWVSEHQVVPADMDFPPAYQFEPLMTLAWAGAVTQRVGLGTSVMILPQHSGVGLANAVASLDALSGGRVTLGAGVGWIEGEYQAMGASFADRGPRMDETLDLLRACWRDDPIHFDGAFHHVEGVRLLPKPARPIPIWIGGKTERAYRRATGRGDGFQFLRTPAGEVAPIIGRLRGERPEASFTLSVRVDWDGLRTDESEIRRELEGYRDAGMQHVLCCPAQRSLDDWLRSVEAIAKLCEPFRDDREASR